MYPLSLPLPTLPNETESNFNGPDNAMIIMLLSLHLYNSHRTEFFECSSAFRMLQEDEIAEVVHVC